MTRTRLAALALGTVAALTAAGCGGGDDDKGLSKDEYLKQGNAICAKGNAKINAGIEQLGQTANTARIRGFTLTVLVPTVEGELKDLRALEAPEDDADTLTALYDDADAALQKIKANPGLAQAQGADDPFAAVNKRATAYGLTECGAG